MQLDSEKESADVALSDSKAKLQAVRERKEEASQRLAEANKDLERCKEENENVKKMAENIPKLSQAKTLMYKISRMTLDPSKEKYVSGFILNKNNVKPFKFNVGDGEVSSNFVTNYLWEQIGAETKEEWRQSV